VEISTGNKDYEASKARPFWETVPFAGLKSSVMHPLGLKRAFGAAKR
jgi:hypothetical protein